MVAAVGGLHVLRAACPGVCRGAKGTLDELSLYVVPRYVIVILRLPCCRVLIVESWTFTQIGVFAAGASRQPGQLCGADALIVISVYDPSVPLEKASRRAASKSGNTVQGGTKAGFS